MKIVPFSARATTALAVAALAVAGLADSHAAQGFGEVPVEATWYARADGARLEGRLVLEIDEGYHVYHTDLGHPRATGMPTEVSFEGAGASFGDPVFPEPHAFPETDWTTRQEIEVLGHEGRVVIAVAGELATPGVVPAGLTANVKGLVCNELGCVPFDLAGLEPEGTGDDALFAAAGDTHDAEDPVDLGDHDWLESGEADATLYLRRGEGDVVKAALVIAVNDGYHLYGHDLGHPDGASYAKATELEWEDGPVTWGEVRWPEGHRLDIPFTDGVWVYSYDAHDSTIVYAEGTAPRDADLSEVSLVLRGQTCDDLGCIDYVETVVNRGTGPGEVWAGFGGEDAHAPEVGGEERSTGAPKVFTADGADGEEQEGLLKFLLLAVGWGLFALVMPCTYPMIPITISFFTKQAEARGGSVLPLALAYGAGIVGIFIFIGVVFGGAIIPFANHPVTNLIIGVLFVYFSLVLFGLINMNPPRFLMNAAGKASMKGGYAGVFLMGATLVVTSFTCTGPFVGNLLGVGAKFGLWQVALGMGVFGLTMAIPFVVLSLLPGQIRTVPRAGQWMDTVKHYLGFVELAAAFKFLSNADIAWNWSVISREFFLLVWAAAFLLGGLYLLGAFGWIRGKFQRPAWAAALFGLLSIAFGSYCAWGYQGRTMDDNMQALIPPYSGGRLFPELWNPNVSWPLVADDYDEAFELAKAEGRLLLVNFTGHL